MQLEDDALILLRPDPRLPREDVEAIGRRLAGTDFLTPGFVAPPAGLLSLEALLYAEHVEGVPTLILPDHNVVTRMARIAREGARGRDDVPSRFALDLMAFAQATSIGIEPGLAFHELAQVMGDDHANEELRWFRVADAGRATPWIDLAAGRIERLPAWDPEPSERRSLSPPPHRWRCNHAAVLKAAALELDPSLAPVRRFEALVEWMVSDFILAGPAAIFSLMFLAPRAPRGGMVKGLRSPDRSKAAAGIRNAAWDVTYLSELTRRATPASYEQARCVFASCDRALSSLAPLLLIDAEDQDAHRRQLAEQAEPWWGADAGRVVDALLDGIAAVRHRPPPGNPPGVEDHIGGTIACLEAQVLRPL